MRFRPEIKPLPAIVRCSRYPPQGPRGRHHFLCSPMKFTYSSGSRPLEGYTIKRGIGIGGFGEVYFALNDAGKEVAIKKIQRHLDIELRGVRHCLNLKHVNLISLWDIRTNQQGESWVVMEYVPGPSLRDEIESSPTGMLDAQIKHWFLSTASGVAYLHERGIVHRDLKPGNIFHDQDERVIKIGDYGLSKFISRSRRSGQTQAVGTFHYMAPEIGKGVYGKEIDIYALGVILFEMLTGDVPFDGESNNEIIMKHLTMDADLRSVPADFNRVIEKSLRKDPQERYSNVGEMLRDVPWPEIKDSVEALSIMNAVGPLPVEEPPSVHVISTADHPGPQASSASIVDKLPPVIIDGRSLDSSASGIHTEPISDDDTHLLSRSSPWADPSQGKEIEFVDAPIVKSTHPDVAPEHADTDPFIRNSGPVANHSPTKTLIATDQAVLTSSVGSGAQPEPIASAVRTGVDDLVRWWNSGKISAPVRLGVLVVLGIVIIQNSQRFLLAILGLVTGYLVYFAIRSYLLGTMQSAGNTNESRLLRQNESRIRTWLAARPASDQVTDLVGAMLLGAVGAVSVSLLGMAVVGFSESTIKTWAVFTWQTLNCVAVVWSIQLVTVNWSHKSAGLMGHNRSDFWIRLVTMLLTGAIGGAVAFYSASSFEIDLALLATQDFESHQTSGWVFNVMPKLPAFMLAFAGLYGIAHLGGYTDRIRRTRISVFNVIVSLVVAVVLGHLLNVPLTVLCVVAVVMAVAVQIASPWMHPDECLEICRSHKTPQSSR